MKDKEKIILRILKEIGRLLLVVVLPFLFPIIFFGICYHNIPLYEGGSLYSHYGACFKYSRIIILTCPIIMMVILFPFVYRGKLSKLWIIEWAFFFLFILFAGNVIDYVTRVESKPSSIEVEDTLWDWQKIGENEGG
ncbi:MAG: hypothetical protein SPL08_03085 [Pseudomonadota bacterium]|nr:hypothetical protein [Pseudomonadota bacterium]